MGSLQTSLLSIVGELAGGESVAVAVGVSKRLQVTGDTQHVTRNMLNVTPDKSHIFI